MSLELGCLLLAGAGVAALCRRKADQDARQASPAARLAAAKSSLVAGGGSGGESRLVVTLHKWDRDSKLGFKVGVAGQEQHGLVIQSIVHGGLLDAWNTMASFPDRVLPGSKILSVNGLGGCACDVEAMVAELSRPDQLAVELHIARRESDPGRVAPGLLAPEPDEGAPQAARAPEPDGAEQERSIAIRLKIPQGFLTGCPQQDSALVDQGLLGFRVAEDAEGRLVVASVNPGGLLDTWNMQDERNGVRPGHRIVAVNGVRGAAQELKQQLRSGHRVYELLFQGAVSLRNGHQPKCLEHSSRSAASATTRSSASPSQLAPDWTSQVEQPLEGGGGRPSHSARTDRSESLASAHALVSTLDASARWPSPQSKHVVSRRGLRVEDPRCLFRVGRAPPPEVEVIFFAANEEDLRFGDHAFLGSSHDVGPGGLELEAPCAPGRRHRFRSAEAAFQALRFWLLAELFEDLLPVEAAQKREWLHRHEDPTHGGFGSSWEAMMAVLEVKFAHGTQLAQKLVETDDSLLVGCSSAPGPIHDELWSSGSTGEGKNWLGLQLLLVRDRLSGCSHWTSYLERLVDPNSGTPRTAAAAQTWQDLVRSAAMVLLH